MIDRKLRGRYRRLTSAAERLDRAAMELQETARNLTEVDAEVARRAGEMLEELEILRVEVAGEIERVGRIWEAQLHTRRRAQALGRIYDALHGRGGELVDDEDVDDWPREDEEGAFRRPPSQG